MIKKQALPSVQIFTPKVVFGFEELREMSYTNAKNDSKYFIDFISRLRRYCQLSWNDLRSTQRHGYGPETIKVGNLNQEVQKQTPSGLKKLLLLRSTGDNHVFLGHREKDVFQVLFIEYTFGDLYCHQGEHPSTMIKHKRCLARGILKKNRIFVD